ncbi:Uncharacterised protein [Vibrio cholerae]|nr:Uncharacterised protein [Vibrio cholerae]CSD19315.1 Uncharacterised protein [Vibrio cholerae]
MCCATFTLRWLAGISSRCSKIKPFKVRGPSVGSFHFRLLLMSRILALPSIKKLPSPCGVISSAKLGDMDVVNSPTISSKISSSVVKPMISPYSSTIKPMRSLLRWNLSS